MRREAVYLEDRKTPRLCFPGNVSYRIFTSTESHNSIDAGFPDNISLAFPQRYPNNACAHDLIVYNLYYLYYNTFMLQKQINNRERLPSPVGSVAAFRND